MMGFLADGADNPISTERTLTSLLTLAGFITSRMIRYSIPTSFNIIDFYMKVLVGGLKVIFHLAKVTQDHPRYIFLTCHRVE